MASLFRCGDSEQAVKRACTIIKTADDAPDAPNHDKIAFKSCFNGFDESNKFYNGSGSSCENAYISSEGVSVEGTQTKPATSESSKFAQWTNQFLLNWEVGTVLKFDVDPETFRATNLRRA